jgi:hypothetical protein
VITGQPGRFAPGAATAFVGLTVKSTASGIVMERHATEGMGRR